MLILEYLPCKCQLLPRHIGHRDLDRTPEFAETQEKSCKETQEKDEDKPKLEFLRAEERALILLLIVLLFLCLGHGADLLGLHRREDTGSVRIK